MFLLRRKVRILLELLRGRDAHEIPAFERPVILRRNQLVALAGLRDLKRR